MKVVDDTGTPADAETVDRLEDSPERRLLEAIRPIKIMRPPYTKHRSPQPVKHAPGHQFPEFLTVAARNIIAGKWTAR